MAVIPFRLALEKFSLRTCFGSSAESFDQWETRTPLVEHFATDHRVTGPLFPYALAYEHNTCGLIVDGTLSIEGPIHDESSDVTDSFSSSVGTSW